MPNENGMDNFIGKVYKMIMTLFTGVVVQCRFRWFEGIYYNSFQTIGRYFLKPVFLTYYLFDLFRPTLPTFHMKWLPISLNRMFFSEEPALVLPPDLCLNCTGCNRKNHCKHVGKRVIIYINGSYTNREIHDDNLRIISDMFTVPCYGFYNPTSGVLIDTFMDFIQRFTSFNGYKACELLNSMVFLTNTHKQLNEVVLVAHGSGGLLAEQFLRLMRELKYDSAFINKFKFILVGSPVCNMKWTRDESGKLISYTGEYLYERTDNLGVKRPHKAYSRAKFYCNLCCDVDHSRSVPFPYIESIYNSNDLVASVGVGNMSRLCQVDMIDIDGVKIEIPDMSGHYNYHNVNDENYRHYCKSYLARDYNTKYTGDTCKRITQ